AIVAAMRAAFADCGRPPPDEEAVAGVIGLSLTQAVAALCPDPVARPAIAASYRRRYPELEDEVRLFDGVIDTLDALRARGFWLGIVTGKSRAGLRRVMDRFGLHERVLVWRSADCCPSKPHPAMVLECADEMGVRPEATAVIGDAVFDIEMARAAGAAAVGVDFGQPGADRLRQAGARAVVHRFADLLNLFPPLPGTGDSSTMRTRAAG
ncbi:MAG: HAD-IA family hydrolase, partial [Mariprofundaceae bacterium]